MTEHDTEELVCPFVAFDDERDLRGPGPDHRHRCFAETPAAPRALAHQAAYCLSSSFSGCPTFADWARREAAPVKVELPGHALRAAGAPRSGTAIDQGAEGRVPGKSWTAPPPWTAGAAAGATAANAGSAAATGSAATGSAAATGSGSDLPDEDLVRGAAPPSGRRDTGSRSAEPGLDEPPAFLAGRSDRPAPRPPRPPRAEEPSTDGVGRDAQEASVGERVAPSRYASPIEDDLPEEPRSVPEPPRVSVGYAPVGYVPVVPAAERPVAGSGRVGAGTPSWEQPHHVESYPTLKSRGGGGLPRPALYAIVILLIGLGLFATPFILRGLGGGGGDATPAPSASVVPSSTSEPLPTPVPTPKEVVHTVKANETLSKIAAKYGVTVDQILVANPSIKNPNKIAVGDKIVIPQPLPSEITNGEITPAP